MPDDGMNMQGGGTAHPGDNRDRGRTGQESGAPAQHAQDPAGVLVQLSVGCGPAQVLKETGLTQHHEWEQA